MAQNFTKRVAYNRQMLLAVIIPQHRKDGMYYEVNIKGYSRFHMAWSPLERYDIVKEEGITIPYELVLSVSDAIEKGSK
jgi:hypothetical protein